MDATTRRHFPRHRQRRAPEHPPTAALIVAALCALVVASFSFVAGYATAQAQPVLCDAEGPETWIDVSAPGEYPVYQRTCHDGRIVLELD